jgi:hypothetical protein
LLGLLEEKLVEHVLDIHGAHVFEREHLQFLARPDAAALG